jgi:hypothetical protein
MPDRGTQTPRPTRCVDPLADARTVLQNVRIENPSARPDTEDAANRVALALRYLDMAYFGLGVSTDDGTGHSEVYRNA